MSEYMSIVVMGYEITGLAFIVFFMQILEFVGEKTQDEEIQQLNIDIHSFLEGLTIWQKVMMLFVVSVIWLPAVIILAIRLIMCEE